MKYPETLLQLFQILKRLPGVGTKSAERFAFHLLQWPPGKLAEFAALLAQLPEALKTCPTCGCLTEKGAPCAFCSDASRDRALLCILASTKDVYSMEETREFKGVYHVLGALLSPMEGKGPQQMGIDRLKRRIQEMGVREVILALDATLEGDATALFLKKELEHFGASVTRLAFGLPMGSSFEYIDGGTLARALAGRRSF